MSVTRKAPTAAKKRDQPRRQRLAEVLAEREAEWAEARRQNARLFDEVQAKTHDLEGALQEALRQQTATSDILRVIASSPNDLQPVLDNIAETACRLCSAYDAVVLLREGDQLRIVAHHGPIPITFASQQISRGWASGRAVIERRTIHIDDIAEQADEYPVAAALASRGVAAGSGKMLLRANLVVPLMREGDAIGAIGLRRAEPVPFTEGQIELLKTFSDQAVIAIENARLFDEVQARTRDLEESLQQQTATADVLKVISRSAFDLQAVLDTLVRSAAELSDSSSGIIYLQDDNAFRIKAHFGMRAEFVRYLEQNPQKPGRGSVGGRVLLTGAVQNIPDAQVDEEYDPFLKSNPTTRALLGVPLLRDGKIVGGIFLARARPVAFSQRHIDLVTTFADQGVIAIENARLFDEVQARTQDLTEALEHQTATSEVLSAISRSPTKVQPVLDTIARSATELCGATSGGVDRFDGELIHLASHYNWSPEALQAMREIYPAAPGRGFASARAILTRSVVHIPDISQDPEYTATPVIEVGFRSVLAVPMLRDGQPIGAIALVRLEPRPFSDRQIALLQTFADQAVIAINNVRLFDEVQTKTRDLEESLRQQTATANVLKVISRSAFDLDAVLKTLTESARSLSGAATATVFLRDGEVLRIRAESGVAPEFLEYLDAHPIPAGRETGTGRVLMTGETVHIPDVLADPDYDYGAGPQLGNYRALLGVPLIRDGKVEGVFGLQGREPGAFTQRQVELVRTFADQAVIAIENARLFNEVQAKTRDLEESLQQQTATADVLKVISRSAFDLRPVFHTLVESGAPKLCDADKATITRHPDRRGFLPRRIVRVFRGVHGPSPQHTCSARAGLDHRAGYAGRQSHSR